jgi:hypothetical protein
MFDHFERKGAKASQIPKSMRWSSDTNFKLMVIKYAEETNSCARAWKFSVTEPNVLRWRKQKELLKEQIQPKKSISWAQAWEFQCHWQESSGVCVGKT